jgi:cyclin D5
MFFFVGADFNLMNQRPSIIASASILAAYDSTLTKQEMDLRLSVISSWGNLESVSLISNINLFF